MSKPYPVREFSLPTVNGISSKTFEVHLKLYGGYVKTFNTIIEHIEKISSDDSLTPDSQIIIGELHRRKGFEFDGIRNHELFFEQFEKPSSLPESESLTTAISSQYGSIEAWKNELSQVALTRGVGWAIVYFDPQHNSLITTWVDEQHQGHLTGLTPLLLIDMWEHSYLFDYAPADKKDYVTACLEAFDWRLIEERFQHAQNR